MSTASAASEIAPPPHPRDELKSLALEADQFYASDDWKNADAPTRQKYLERSAEVFDDAFTKAESSLDAAEADSFYNSTTAFLQGKMAEHNKRDADEKRRRAAADKSMQVFTERQKVTPEQVSGVVKQSLEVSGGMSAQTRGSGVMFLDGEQGKPSIGVQPLDWTPSAEEFWKSHYDLTASEAEKKSAKDFARSKGKDSLADDLLYRSAVAGEESAKLAARDIAFSKGADAAGVAAAEQEATSAYRRNAKLAALESTQSSDRNPKGRKLPFRVVRTNGMLNIEPEEGKAEEAMMAAERMGLLTSEEAARLIPSGVEMDKEFASRPKAQGGLVTAVKEFGSAILPALGTAAGTAIGAAASKGDVSTAMVGGASGGSAALWLQNKVFGQVDQAQREANARAHPGWAQVGSFVPFLVSMFQKTPPALTTVGKMAQTAKVSLTPGTAAARWESALQSGVAMGRAGFSSGVQQRYVEGNKDVNPFDEGVRSFIAGGAMGILKPAKSILMAMTGKAVKDAAAVTFAEGLYDLAVHNKPIDFKAIADEAPGTFTAFALQNAVMGVFHKFQHRREMAKMAGKSAAAANTAAAEAAEAQAKRFRKDGFIESAIASEALAETHRRAAKQDEKAAIEQYWQDVAKAQKRAAEHTQANEGPLTERAAYGRTGDVYDAFRNVQRKPPANDGGPGVTFQGQPLARAQSDAGLVSAEGAQDAKTPLYNAFGNVQRKAGEPNNEKTQSVPSVQKADEPVRLPQKEVAPATQTYEPTVTAEHFSDSGKFYRVVVGDEAFTDIVNSGVVRTNAGDKAAGGTLAEKMAARPTAFPSFSSGSASMSYAAANPNHYIVVTDDVSIQPSKQGRHGKGTTMFPTDAQGNPTRSLSGKKVQVYKHTGDGNYELVYADGRAVTSPAAVAPSQPAAVPSTPSWISSSAQSVADSASPNVRGQIADLSAQRLTAKEIAGRLGITEDTVRLVRVADGIPPWTNSTNQAGGQIESPEFTAWLSARKSKGAQPAAVAPAAPSPEPVTPAAAKPVELTYEQAGALVAKNERGEAFQKVEATVRSIVGGEPMTRGLPVVGARQHAAASGNMFHDHDGGFTFIDSEHILRFDKDGNLLRDQSEIPDRQAQAVKAKENEITRLRESIAELEARPEKTTRTGRNDFGETVEMPLSPRALQDARDKKSTFLQKQKARLAELTGEPSQPAAAPTPQAPAPVKAVAPDSTGPVEIESSPKAEVISGTSKDIGAADMQLGVSPAQNHFTLWMKQKQPDGRWGRWNYISILGKNRDQANARALEAANRIASGDLTGIAFLGKEKITVPKIVGVLSDQVSDKELMGIDRVSVGEQNVGFGKYSDVQVKELFRKDPNYAMWLVGSASGKRGQQIADYISNQPDFIVSRDAAISAGRDAVNDEAIATLSKHNLTAEPQQDGSIIVGGKTYDWKDTIKQFGGRFDGNSTGWRLQHDQFKSFLGKLEGVAPAMGGQRGGLPAYTTNPVLGKLRADAEARPDRSGIEGSVQRYISDDTAALIHRGSKFGMPKDVLDEQVEDVARINRAYQDGKGMFLLASQPGSGKTFVLGAAIRELRKSGAKKIYYVTLREELIQQIQNDLAAYGIGDVEFITYPKMRTGAPQASDVIIFDEAHAIKNVGQGDETVQQAEAARKWIAKSKFTLLSTATPFENPVQAAYLEPTGIFDPVGGHEQFAMAFGATKMKFKDGSEILIWKRGSTSDIDQAAARDYLQKEGVFTSRKIRLPESMVDSRLVKVQADKGIAEMYAAFSEAAAENENSLTGFAPAWIVNFQKRLLEAGKVRQGIEEAESALKRGRSPIIFVETKAERKIDIPDLIEREQEWKRACNQALADRDKPPARAAYGLPPRGITEVMESFMAKTGIKIVEIPSAEDLIVNHFGKDKVAIFTGSVTPKKAQDNLARWRGAKDIVLVATMAKGGTGLSLHDKDGNHPTTQININLPWSATGVVQVAQRSARYGLASKAEMQWLFAENIPFDRTLGSRVGGRMADMGAVVHGEKLSGAAEIENWDFESKSFRESNSEAQAEPKPAPTAPATPATPAAPQAEGGIFGYSWADIRGKQQGGTLAALIRGKAMKPKATESDFAVLEKHGMDWLYDNKKGGIIDRLGLPAERPSKKAVGAKPPAQSFTEKVRAKIVPGAKVSVQLVRGAKLAHPAIVRDVFLDSKGKPESVSVTFDGGKKKGITQTVPYGNVSLRPGVESRMLTNEQFEGMTKEEARKTRAAAVEFKKLVIEYPELGFYSGHLEAVAAGPQGEAAIKKARADAYVKAMMALGVHPDKADARDAVTQASLVEKMRELTKKPIMERKQYADFQEAKGEGDGEIKAGDLKYGETINIGGEEMRVIDIDRDGVVTLQDGEKFGTQEVHPDESLMIKGEAPKPVASKPTTYINGDKAEYTGETREIAGGTFYVVKFLEGNREGTEGVTQRRPDGTSPDDGRAQAEWQQQQADARKIAAAEELARAKVHLSNLENRMAYDRKRGITNPEDVKRRGELQQRITELEKPAEPATPKLRPSDGKGTGELLQGDAAPFNLVAETAADIAKREEREAAEQVAKEAKDAAEAKAKQDKEQGNLFDEDPFAIADSAPATSLPVASVQRAVRVVAERLAGAMPHEVIADGSAFPDRVKEVFLERYGSSGDLNRIRGAVVDGKIWINAAAIENPRQAIETFMHEAAGHGGVDALLQAFGEKATAQLDAMLKRLFPDEHAAVKRSYPSREQVSETLAKIMEGVGPEMSAQHRTRWQRVVDWLRNALNKLGVKQWSTNDVMALLRRGVDAVRKQRARAADVRARVSEARGDGPKMSADNEQSKPFYSALTKTVQGLPQETMTVQQAAGMLGEYQVHKTTVLPDGKKKVEVLGKFNPLDKAKATALATQKGGEVKWASQKGVKEDEVNMAGILTDPLSPLSGKQPGDKVTKSELTGYALERQATVQDVVLKTAGVSRADVDRHTELLNIRSLRRFTPEEAGEMRQLDGRMNRDATDETHFSRYQLPGADEGSYREMFVTWPGLEAVPFDAAKVTIKRERSSVTQGTAQIYYNGKPVGLRYADEGSAATDWKKPDSYWIDFARKQYELGYPAEETKRNGWSDGHSQYSDIANPIVRIRRNIRTDAEGRKTYFIEEMQGPGKGEQEKMPPELRKRIYEIGMKRALRDAVDEGADAIAWTTGEQQAERYSLEKEVEGIEWEKDAAGEWSVDVDTKQDGLINAAVSPDGVIVSSDESRLNGKPLEDFVGKEIAEKIMASKKGKLSGEGLKVGGKGLKRVYDQMLPAIANDLAKKFGVKAGRAEIPNKTGGGWMKQAGIRAVELSDGTFGIRDSKGFPNGPEFATRQQAETYIETDAGERTLSAVHSLPIPEALKTQQRGGNVLFSLKGENPEATSTTKKAVMDKEREVAMLQGSADKLLQDIRKSGRPPTVEEMQQIAAIDSLIAKRQAEIQAEASNVAQGATPPEINIADMNAEPPDREETGESGPRTYGGKFDSMDAQRAERGLPPLARRFRKANRVLWDAAVKRFETEPKWADRLVDEISSGEKTVLTDEEFAGVFAQQIDLHNKRQEAADRARDPNLSEEEQRDALDQFQYYEKKLQASEILKGMAGSEAGAALQSLKLMANEDFSLAAMEARERKAKQSGLTPEEVDRIRDEATRIAKAQADLDARKAATEAAERIANAEAKIAEWSKIPSRVLEYAKQKLSELVSAGNAAGERLRARAGQVNVGVDPTILGDIFLFARGKIAQGIESFGNFAASTASEFGEWVSPYLKPAWDKAMKYFNANQPERKVSSKQKARQQAATEAAASIEDGIRAMAEEGLPDDMGRYVKQLANEYVKSGATTVKGVMARLHAFLDPVMGNPTDDVLLDLWTDYGKGKAATEDALKRLQSQIRQEALLVRQIIDAEAALVRSQAGEDVGDYLKLTGQQRVPVRDQARALAQQLNELKKKIPPPQGTAESRRQSALDALEKRTRNRIKDLRFEIAKGERTIKNRGVTPTSPNLEALRAELATVKAEHLAVFGRREATPEQKLKSAIKSAERAEQKALAELEAAKRGVFTRPVQKGAETRNEVLVIRARADAARAETQALKELANPPLSDAQKRLDAALVARERWEQMLAGEQQPTSRQPQESLTQLEEDARMEIAAMRELAAQIRRDAKPATDPDDAKVRALEAAAAEYERRVNESDFTAKSKTTTADSARVAQARALRDAALAAYNAAKNAAGVTEQTKLANRKAAMLRQIADLTDRLAKSDFEKRPPRPPVDLSKDPEAVRIASDLQEIKSNYAKRLLHYIKERRGGYEKFTDALWTAFTAERSLMGSGDLSAPRQAVRMVKAHPIMAAKAMWRSIRTIFSQKQAVSYEAERKLRPNYALYKPMKIQMPSVEAEAHDRMAEEGVRSNIEDWADIKLSGNPLLVLPKLVPKLLGHYVRASSRTFTTFLNELAADVADYRINELRDKPMSKIEKEALGDMINSGRGRGLKAGAGKLAQFVFYSANFLAARAKNLSGYHVWRRNSSMRIRKIALKEQFRAIAGWMVVSAISRYFYGDTGDDEDMFDKAKRLFKMKVTDSDARMEYDYTGGEVKLARIGAALIEGISTTIQAMRSGQEEADKQRAFKSYATIGREIRSISAPWVGVATDLFTGSNYDGKVPTVTSIARDLTVPLAWRSADEFFERAGFAKTVGAKLQEAIGVGVSVTRDKTAPKERRYSR